MAACIFVGLKCDCFVKFRRIIRLGYKLAFVSWYVLHQYTVGCAVALHAEAVNESAILVTWAAKATSPYTVYYWLADDQADAASVVR